MVHAFFYAAFGHEAGLHGGQQFVEHICCLVDEGDAEVGQLFVIHALDIIAASSRIAGVGHPIAAGCAHADSLRSR